MQWRCTKFKTRCNGRLLQNSWTGVRHYETITRSQASDVQFHCLGFKNAWWVLLKLVLKALCHVQRPERQNYEEEGACSQGDREEAREEAAAQNEAQKAATEQEAWSGGHTAWFRMGLLALSHHALRHDLAICGGLVDTFAMSANNRSLAPSCRELPIQEAWDRVRGSPQESAGHDKATPRRGTQHPRASTKTGSEAEKKKKLWGSWSCDICGQVGMAVKGIALPSIPV